MNSFLITGHGRCGTKFLSNVMNRSKKWNVKHEPRGLINYQFDINKVNEEYLYKIKIPEKTQKAFSKKNYGEVNSHLRYHFHNLNVYKKGIIYRDYKEVITSFYNRKNWGNIEDHMFFKIYEINFFHNFFHKLLSNNKNIIFIDFFKMTNNKKYLEDVLLTFDINDVKINNSILSKKINTNKTNKKYNDMPEKYKKEIEKLNWKEYNFL